jgi:hypothetical protein
MTTYPEASSSQVAVYPASTGLPVWLGTLGHVTGLKYSYIYPGGCDKMSCTLEVPATYRSDAVSLGATTRIFRGGHKLWEGQLDEPAPTTSGYNITGVGVGNKGQDYLAIYTDAWPTNEPDEVVNNAITRGLPWVNPGIGTPSGIWTGQAQDTASRYVADILNLACTRGGLGWYVNSQPGGVMGNGLSVAPLPTTPTRLLICTTPVPRSSGGDVSAIYIKYQIAADNATTGATATYGLANVVNVGHSNGREVYIDLSNAGVMTLAAAQAVGGQIIKVYQHASFVGPFTAAPGYLLTMGGVPVDPACEQAGGVYQLIVTDFAYGGEITPITPITFVVGSYEWDDQARIGSVGPYQNLDTSLSGLLSATQTTMTPITVG